MSAPVQMGEYAHSTAACSRSAAGGGGGGPSATARQAQPTGPRRLLSLALAVDSSSGQNAASGRHLTADHALAPRGMSKPVRDFRRNVLIDAE
jgi:hypothetical protein